MRRKLVKQGPSTLTVSLPSEWIQVNKLLPGQEIILTIENNTLIIKTEKSEAEKEADGPSIAVDCRELSSKMIVYILGAFHKKGFEEVFLKVTKAQTEIIQTRALRDLIGFEIVQQATDSLTIRFVTRVDSEELPILIRRAFLVTLSMAEGLVNTAGDGTELLVLEETNNRIVNYCERMINKNLHKQEDSVFLYLIVWLLEKIADEYRDIIKRGRIDKEDAKITYELLKEYYDLFYKYSFKKHDEFNQKLLTATEALRNKKSPFIHVLLTLDQTKATTIALQASLKESHV